MKDPDCTTTLYWKKCVQLCREFGRAYPDRYIEIFYEDLVSDFKAKIKELIEYCELEWYNEYEQSLPEVDNRDVKWKTNLTQAQKNELRQVVVDYWNEVTQKDA